MSKWLISTDNFLLSLHYNTVSCSSLTNDLHSHEKFMNETPFFPIVIFSHSSSSVFFLQSVIDCHKKQRGDNEKLKKFFYDEWDKKFVHLWGIFKSCSLKVIRCAEKKLKSFLKYIMILPLSTQLSLAKDLFFTSNR